LNDTVTLTELLGPTWIQEGFGLHEVTSPVLEQNTEYDCQSPEVF
jgi:hypothetical protein